MRMQATTTICPLARNMCMADAVGHQRRAETGAGCSEGTAVRRATAIDRDSACDSVVAGDRTRIRGPAGLSHRLEPAFEGPPVQNATSPFAVRAYTAS